MRPVFFYKPTSSRTDTSWRWWFNVWTPVVLAVAVICIESTATLSSQNTSGWLRPVVQRLVGAMNDSTWDFVHHAIRKTGHFVGYGTVGFTFLRAWLHTLGRRGSAELLPWRLESTILAIFSTAIVASGDEFHQSFLPSRTGTPVDVLLDTAGATTLCLLVWLICWSRRNPGFDVLES
jgi:VanZ family protein